MSKDFRIDDVLGFGWRVMKSHFGFFVKIFLVYIGILILLGFLEGIAEKIPIPVALKGVIIVALAILRQVIQFVMAIGLIKIALSFCDQQIPTTEMLFDGFDCFWRFIGVQILSGLIVFGGTLLFVIPGIIWAIQFQFGTYFVIDHGLGPIDALKASSRITRGVKLKLFGFGFLCGLITLLGLLCFLVGIFAAVPIVMVAVALVYRHLAMQTPELAEFGIQYIYLQSTDDHGEAESHTSQADAEETPSQSSPDENEPNVFEDEH